MNYTVKNNKVVENDNNLDTVINNYIKKEECKYLRQLLMREKLVRNSEKKLKKTK